MILNQTNHVEGTSSLLQQTNQTSFSEVFSSTDSFLIWADYVIRDGTFFQHIPWYMLKNKKGAVIQLENIASQLIIT